MRRSVFQALVGALKKGEIHIADYRPAFGGHGRTARLFLEGSGENVDPRSLAQREKDLSQEKRKQEQERALKAIKESPGVFGFMAAQLKDS